MIVELLVEVGEGLSKGSGCERVGEVGEAGSEETVVGAREEECDAPSTVGESVTVCLLNPFDECVEAKAAEIVSHATGAELVGGEPEQRSEVSPKLAIREALRLQPEDDHCGQESLDARVAEAEGWGALPMGDGRATYLLERFLADDGVVTEALGVQQTPVGGEADLPQGGQIAQPSADAEVIAVVDRRLGT